MISLTLTRKDKLILGKISQTKKRSTFSNTSMATSSLRWNWLQSRPSQQIKLKCAFWPICSQVGSEPSSAPISTPKMVNWMPIKRLSFSKAFFKVSLLLPSWLDGSGAFFTCGLSIHTPFKDKTKLLHKELMTRPKNTFFSVCRLATLSVNLIMLAKNWRYSILTRLTRMLWENNQVVQGHKLRNII